MSKLDEIVIREIWPDVEKYRLTPGQVSRWIFKNHGIRLTRQAVAYRLDRHEKKRIGV